MWTWIREAVEDVAVVVGYLALLIAVAAFYAFIPEWIWWIITLIIIVVMGVMTVAQFLRD